MEKGCGWRWRSPRSGFGAGATAMTGVALGPVSSASAGYGPGRDPPRCPRVPPVRSRPGPPQHDDYTEPQRPLVFFTDSDGQYVLADFWKLAKHIDHYDLVHGAKLGRKDPFVRRICSMLFNKLASFLFEIHYLDINSGFRLVKSSVVKDILEELTVMPTLINAELLLRVELKNYDIRQVYIRHRERRHGASRGLPLRRYPWEAFRAGLALFQLKESYRK